MAVVIGVLLSAQLSNRDRPTPPTAPAVAQKQAPPPAASLDPPPPREWKRGDSPDCSIEAQAELRSLRRRLEQTLEDDRLVREALKTALDDTDRIIPGNGQVETLVRLTAKNELRARVNVWRDRAKLIAKKAEDDCWRISETNRRNFSTFSRYVCFEIQDLQFIIQKLREPWHLGF